MKRTQVSQFNQNQFTKHDYCNFSKHGNICSFQVTDDLVGDLLEEDTLAEALEKKKLFIVNHKIIDGVPAKNKDYEVHHPQFILLLNTSKI